MRNLVYSNYQMKKLEATNQREEEIKTETIMVIETVTVTG